MMRPPCDTNGGLRPLDSLGFSFRTCHRYKQAPWSLTLQQKFNVGPEAAIVFPAYLREADPYICIRLSSMRQIDALSRPFSTL